MGMLYMHHRPTNFNLSYEEEMNIKLLLTIVCFLRLFVAGCSLANEQEAEQILSVAAETTVAGIVIVPETPAATMEVNFIVTQIFAAMAAEAASQKPAATVQAPTATQTQSAPAATLPLAVATGSVSGQLMYPASGIPSFRVVAFQVGASNIYHVDTVLGKNAYQAGWTCPRNLSRCRLCFAGWRIYLRTFRWIFSNGSMWFAVWMQ